MNRIANKDYDFNTPISIQEMEDYFAVSRTTIYRWVGAGDLPKPFRVGRRICWKKGDVLAMYEKRQADIVTNQAIEESLT